MQRTGFLKAILTASVCNAALIGVTYAAEFNIPAGDLRDALSAYMAQTGTQIVVSESAIQGAHTGGVRGSLEPDAALDRLLRGSGFAAHRDPSGITGIVRSQTQSEAEVAPLQLAQASSPRASVETVTVTSSKLGGADVQSVPIAITALSQEQLTATQTAGGPDLIKQVPAGSMGLTLQPYWSPGVRNPGPEAKGAIIGFGDVHTRAHLYRAIIEGLVYSLRAGREQIERRTGKKIRRVVVAGGGSQSDQAMQITADVFGLTVERPEIYETSALGSAINLAVGLGVHPDYPAAIEAMTRIGSRFEPRADAREIYDALYREVYQPLYPRLRPLYKKIRGITGYPA